jgi:hypothetical protein
MEIERDPAREDGPRLRRWVPLAVAAAVTAGLLWLALMLGAWGFDYRRFSYHEGRLRRMVDQKPTLGQVVQGLKDDGSPLLAAPSTAEEVRQAAERWGGPRAAEIVEKARRHAYTRVFRASDVVYFLYFDAEGILRDFTYVSV